MTYAWVKNNRGHRWKKDSEDGRYDIFGYDEGTHNGPRCVLCGYGFCHHCHDTPSIDCTGGKPRRVSKGRG